jgi:hypothetical protein
MTSEQMREIRNQGACVSCQGKSELQGKIRYHSFYAIGNAQNCDNCLMLVEVRMALLRESQGPCQEGK